MNELKNIATRVYLLYVLLALAGLGIIGKVAYIQAIPNEEAAKRAAMFTYKINDIIPERGKILAADGSLLATSIPEYEIRWDSQAGFNQEQFDLKVDSLCEGLARIVPGKTAKEFKEGLLTAIQLKNRYLKIADHLNYNQLQQFKKLPFVNKKKNRTGFIIIPKEKRSKPFGSLAARTIGIYRQEKPVGLEAYYDSLLRGKVGKQLQEKIAGDVWKPMTDDFIEEPEPGFDIVTTLDVHLQDAAQSSLKKTMELYHADWGCVILMEVQTGHIKALANLSYDSIANKYYERENLAINQSIEPGSTMKLASILAAIEEANLPLDKVIHTGNGELSIAGTTLKDVKAIGSATIETVFAKSSNVGTALLVSDVFASKPQKFLDYLTKFGYNEHVGIDLLGEGDSHVKTSVKDPMWSDLSLSRMSIGYELQVTPIQQLCFYNAIANNGVYMKPQLVSELRRNGVTYEKIEPVVLRKDFLSPATIEKGRKLMEAVTTVGTGKGVFKHAPYKAAGKTGTARIYKNGGYLESAHRASFVGYFPADKPKYSCIVVINEAKVFEAFGGKVAAPVFRDLANILFGTELDIPHDNSLEGDSTFVANPWYPQILAGYSNSVKKAVARVPFAFGIQSDANQISVSIQNNVPSVNSRDVDTGIVPDVRGMGLTDAMYALESRGLKVVAKGYGKVVYQSILPGTKARHQQINIELR